ncbi:helix-turn-helix transcriptional regulator [Rhizobium oryzicola]|uniref:AraC family transcriptional regulator n=1 Tax=Rhizobium oryzicola TaxID=1232668 RepID=A0ABT8T689_9HYPH|nr:AraC family transcriptional regulator [Rhizobium oryzicola]MDO1585246.1 AraC family transcriptional regulator [Rhizobium oryzicola]
MFNTSTFTVIVSENLAEQVAAEPSLTDRERAAILKASAIIHANLACNASIPTLASAVGLSQRRLVFGFKQIFDTTVYGHLRECRMEAARRMLEETDMPLKQIAYLVGYGHANNLIAAFRSRYGVPPRRHARQLACA